MAGEGAAPASTWLGLSGDMWVTIAITVVATLVSLAVGALITWLVTRRYYIRATIDLEHHIEALKLENEQSRRLTNSLILYLEGEGLIRPQWLPDGTISDPKFLRDSDNDILRDSDGRSITGS